MSIRIAVIGAGNMGGALIGGIVNRVTPAACVAATTRTPERAAELAVKYGIQATAGGNREAAAQADLIVLAVKPDTLPKVLASIEQFQKGYMGEVWKPAPLLVKLAKEGRKFNS